MKSLRILVARKAKTCPLCGGKIKKGSNYVNDDGLEICTTCGLPQRRLIPINQYIPKTVTV